MFSIDNAIPTPTGKPAPLGGAPPTSMFASANIDLSKMSIEESIGVHVKRLGVGVKEGVACYVAGSQYSVPRLKAHFGTDLCWPVAVSNKRGTFALTVCPCKGMPGHEVKGTLHH